MVSQHHVGQQGRVGRISRAEVNVEIPVIIDVPEIRPHRHEDFVESSFFGYVLKSSVLHVSKEMQSLGVWRKLEVAAHAFLHRHIVATDK